MLVSLTLLLAVSAHVAVSSQSAFRQMFAEKMPDMIRNGVDPGEPVFLTPLLEKGEIKKAREMSRTTAPIAPMGHAGYFTVNKTTNSNMFFWFLPAQFDHENAPVLLWLQGGPGGSSLFGLFVENGPLEVDKAGNLHERNITWNRNYSMIYIDNPVGTGFSFTDKDEGYATNEVDVGRDLYSCLTQFFQVFSPLQKNDFYVTGESYAGKYVPAIAYKIHMENPTAKVKINLKGIAIGDGLCDPITMFPKYSDFMFNIGVLDENERDYFKSQTDVAVKMIANGKYLDAFKVIGKVFNDGHQAFFYNATALDNPYNFLLTEIFDMLLNGDLTKGPPYFKNVTGTSNYYNFLMTTQPADMSYYVPLLAKPEIRRAIHVGNLTYNDGSMVEKYLMNDITQSVKPWLVTLMNNYKVLIYNGQLDIIVAVPLTEAWLQTVPWKGLDQYKKAPKMIWKIHPSDTEVAGYVRQVGDFYQVVVRDAGHILPYDQPARGLDMITRFIENN